MKTLVVWVSALLAGLGVPMQAPGARVDILSPEGGSYVSGPTLLRAAIEGNDSAVSRLQFFTDGSLACSLEGPPFECQWDAGPTIQEHQVRAVVTLSDGQRLVRNIRTKAVKFDDTVDVEAVLVTATVSDGDRFVKGLAQDQFRVFEDDKRQTLTHFAAENVPLELVVAVDISSSMTTVLPQVKRAVKDFLASLRPEDRVTLVAFNDNVFTIARKETDQGRRARALDRLNAWGGTALYDVIVKGLDLLERQQGRRAVVLFTDGHDRSSRNSLEQAQRAVETSDASLYLIVQGRGEEIAQSRKIVEHLAEMSGGRAFIASKIDRLQDDFRTITEELSNQYLLAYVPTDSLQDDRWRKIRVELTGGKYKVRARQGYRAAAGVSAQ